MRILWLSHLLPWPPKGGLMQRSYYLMRELARHHEVRIVAFRQRAHQPDETWMHEAMAAISEFAELKDVFDLPEDRRLGGRPLLALHSLFPGPPYTIRWGMCPEYRDAVQRAITEFRPEVVHFDTVSLAPYLDLCGNVPAVLNHHNIESHMLLRRAEQETNPLKKFYFWQEGTRLAAYERKVARQFHLHLVCADLDGERLVGNVGSVPVEVVPNGVDLAYFQPASAGTIQRPDSMIFVGGLSWYPNAAAMRFFVEQVWPTLSERRPAAELSIIGRSPPTDLAKAAQRDPRIQVMGFVDDIRPIVDAAMVYICPIFDGGGTKLKMIDAMAMGKAIVAHPVAAEGLGLTNGHDVLMTEDPGEMAELCIRLFDDPDLRRRIGQAARTRAEQVFGFDAIGAALAKTYATLPPNRR
ncbi:MAG: glycosyltransferase family 4 protein [Wenzhouxiangella sp.]